MTPRQQPILDTLRGRGFGSNTCFLFGRSDGKLTAEHVFPQWLQRRFNLWNKRQRLINGADIRYTHWKVPCCSECNSTHLKPVEDTIAKATLHGRGAAVRSLIRAGTADAHWLVPTSDSFEVFLPRHKSIPEMSCAYRASVIGDFAAGIEDWDIPGLPSCRVEAMPMPAGDDIDVALRVVALLRL
jgi:hypothetical protein